MTRNKWFKVIIFLYIFLLIFTAFSYTLQSVPPVTQETLIVDITGNGNFTSIQDAINYADVTDKILIRKGVYNENNLVINKKIEIIGEDPSNTIIDCLGNIAFVFNSSFIDIRDLQIINTEEFAIIVNLGSSDCTISNCIINTNYKGVAIDIRSSYNIVSDCNLIGLDTSKQGVKIQGSYNIIKNCDIQNFANGVLALINSHKNQISNCNIINNENAIDFRLNSNNNVVINCNIYSNLQGIRISQNSNKNLIYLNNFWKNDLDVIDECNNSWDNGIYGNYWVRYKGEDNNGDGIGDIPYTISKGVEDRYPFMEMILPDIIIGPSNLKQISGKSDSTPTFNWDSSQYSKGINGYYVKIDNSPEAFIGNTTTWTSSNIVSDGIHTFYVRAEGMDNKLSNYSILTFSIDSTFIDTDNDGWSDQEEEVYGSDPNNPYNYPSDTDGDHKPNSVDTDDDNDGYSDSMENSYNTNSINKNDYPADSDRDGIPDESSPDGKYLGDEDDDNDGLTDSVEASIGSNSKDGSDATRVYFAGNLYFLVDLSKNDIYDILYEPASKKISGVEKIDNNYLIDINKDGLWDHIYRASDGSTSKYKDESEITLPIWLIIILIVLPIVIFYYLRKKSIKYITSQEQVKILKKPVIKQPIKLPVKEKRETVDMISETRALLQYIQKDVEIYMEKLREIEGQFIESEEIQEEIVKTEEEQEPVKPDELQIIDIEEDKTLESKKPDIEEQFIESEELKEEIVKTEEEQEPVKPDGLEIIDIEEDKTLESKKEHIKETKETPEDMKPITEEEEEPTILDEIQTTELEVDKLLKSKKEQPEYQKTDLEEIPVEKKSITEEEEEPTILDEYQKTDIKLDKIFDFRKKEFKDTKEMEEPITIDDLENMEIKIDKILDSKKEHFKEADSSRAPEVIDLNESKKINRKLDKSTDSKNDEDDNQE